MDSVELVHRWLRLLDAHDFEQAHEVLAEDVVLTNTRTGKAVQGIEGIQRFNVPMRRLAPEARREMEAPQVDDGIVRFTVRFTGAFTGEAEVAGHRVEGNGQRFDVRARLTAQVQEGRIKRITTDLDRGEVLRQVGLVPT